MFVFILMVLFGCELEQDAIQKNSYQEKIKIRRSTFDALLKEQNFVNAFSKLSKRQNKGLQSKTIMEAEYGFTVVPTLAKVIESAGSTSYTFKITREINSVDYFENLVIDTDSTGQTNAYVFKYSPTEPIETVSYHDSFHFKGNIQITPIVYNTSEAGKDIVCITANVMMCNQAETGGVGVEHVAEERCKNSAYLYSVRVTTCDSTAGGGSPGAGWTGGGSGNPQTEPGVGHTGGGSGTGGNSGSSNPPVTTAPVYEDAPSDCKKINKQFTKFPTLKQELINLAATTSESHENGFFIDKTATATTANPIQNFPAGSGTGGSIDINPNPSQKYTMIAHTHDASGADGQGTYSIFSYGDLAAISNIIQHNKLDANEFVFYVITADGTRYALTIDCAPCLMELCYPCGGNNTTGTPVNVDKLLDRDQWQKQYYNKSNGIHAQSDKENDKKVFLNFIKEVNLGVSLFEVDATFTNFEKLDYNSKTNSITKVPCQN